MNTLFTCGNCGTEFVGAFKEEKPPHCPLCRHDPTKKRMVVVRQKQHRFYVPVGLRVKVK